MVIGIKSAPIVTQIHVILSIFFFPLIVDMGPRSVLPLGVLRMFSWHIAKHRAISSYKYLAVLSFRKEQASKTLQEWKENPKIQATPNIHLSSDWTTAKTKYHTCISIQDLSWDLSLIARKYYAAHLFTSNSLTNITPPICQDWQLPCPAVCP